MIWMAKLSLNPWYRREIHLRHHQESGRGDRHRGAADRDRPASSLRRLLVAIHPMAGLLLFREIKKDVPDFQPMRLPLMSVLTYLSFLVIWESFFGYWRLQNGQRPASTSAHFLPPEGYPVMRDPAVLLVLRERPPAVLVLIGRRTSHYYEDTRTGTSSSGTRS